MRAGLPNRNALNWLVGALLAAASSAAGAQTTGSIPHVEQTSLPSWSGESGASGDPRMSAAAIR
ncbi:MAG TPA: lytic murein transglycosylase, partial [Pseudolabrys sp.]|nr:lytic murein transglycosylase [Pseudolabrys sp.]